MTCPLRSGFLRRTLHRVFIVATATLVPGSERTVAAAEPRLEIRRGNSGELRLAWPLQPPAKLEARSALAGPEPWQDVDAPAQVVDGWNVLAPEIDVAQRFYRLRLVPVPTTTRIVERSPVPGEGGVSVTRETTVRFTRPVEMAALADPDLLVATSGDRRLLGRVELAADRLSATLFHLEPLPAATRIRVSLNGAAFIDAAGDAVDADADGAPGGRTAWEFDTAPIHALPGTAITGRVLASERVSGTNVPLAGVTITVDGAEETLRIVTAADGTFRLDPSPAGRFFVHVDGRTAVASQWPQGAYYPFVGKAWDAIPGKTNNLANGDGLIFLPRIAPSALQPVQPNSTTVITAPTETLETHPALSGVRLAIPPNALFADSGVRGGRVGLAAVEPDRLPEPLPPGLNLALVITIQTDGAMNFDQPVPVRFPNLPDPVTGVRLPPGARTAIWSFNHDTGRWEIAAPAVVTADGQFAESLPGTGIRQPGWHGAAPGSSPRGPGDGPRRPEPENSPEEEQDCDQAGAVIDAALGTLECATSLAGASTWANALGNLTGNLVDYVESIDDSVQATSTPGFSCERFSSLFSQLNIIGRTVADLARPVIVTGDPSRFAAAAAGCLIDGVQIATRLGCAVRCANGSIDAARCEELNAITDGGFGLVDLAQADSAADAAITAVELTGDRLAEAWSAHCRGDTIPSLHGTLASGTDTEAEVRRLALELRDQVDTLRTALARALAAAEAFFAQYRAVESQVLEAASRWMIEDRLWSGAYYRLATPGFSFRQRVGPTGDFQLPMLGSSLPYTLAVYLPGRSLYAVAHFRSAEAGEITDIPVPRLMPLGFEATASDRDGDGLPDVVEEVFGSLPDDPDTDRDGTPDGLQAARGENPVGGAALRDGVIASVPADGTAVDLVEAGPRTVAVAVESGSLQLFDTTNPAAPIRAGSLRIGTTRPRLAAHATSIVVTDDSPSLHLYDVSDPRSPSRRWTVPGRVRAGALAVNATRVFAHLDGQLVALDRVTGTRQFALPGVEATHLQWIDDTLAAYAGGQVRLYRIDPDAFTPVGSLTLPVETAVSGQLTPRLRSAGDFVSLGGFGGTAFFSIADRRAPALLGSLLGVNTLILDAIPTEPATVAVIARGDGDTRVVIQDISSLPAQPTIGTAHETPGVAAALLLHQGFVYVADGAAGLTVIFQRPLNPGTDPGGALSIALAGSFTRTDAQEEGAPFTLSATVRGGRPARVDFYEGDSRLGAARFPFRWTEAAPRADALPSNLVFTARAVSTSGLAATSAPVVIPLVRETTPPRPTAFFPAEGALIPAGTTPVISATFSEAIDPTSLDAITLTLWEAGPDTVYGTSDDLPVAAGPIEITGGGRVLRRTPSEPLRPGRHGVRLGQSLADLRGNRVAESVSWTFETERQVRWISDDPGAFGDASRWEGGTVPNHRDLAVIERPAADPVVRLDEPDLFVGGILSREPVVVTRAVHANRSLRFDGGLSVSNRALINAQGPVTVRGGSGWTGPGGIVVEASELTLGGRNRIELSGPAGLMIRNAIGGAPLLVLESGGELELHGATILQTDSFHTGSRILNAGTLRSVAVPGATNKLVTRALENRGLIHAAGGHLELHNPAHLGRLVIDAETVVSFLGTPSAEVRAAAASSISGEGDLRFDFRSSFGAPPPTAFAGSITLGGGIAISATSSISFRGDRVDAAVLDAAGRVELRGLAARLGTLILRDSTLLVATGTPTEVGRLDSAAGPFGATGGRVRVESTLAVVGPTALSSLTLTGPGTARLAGPVTVSNLVVVSEGATLELGSTLQRTASGRVAGSAESTLRILPEGRLDLTADRSVVTSGRFHNDGTLTFTQTVLERASFRQGRSGRLIATLGPDGSHDRLAVASATLGGTLEVRLAPGANPIADQEFVLVEAARLSGTFDAVALPDLPSGRRLEVRYTPTGALVRVLP